MRSPYRQAGMDLTLVLQRWLRRWRENDRNLLTLLLIASVIAAGLFAILMVQRFTPNPAELTRIPYSDFKAHLSSVAEVSTARNNIDGEMRSPLTLKGFKKPVRSFTTQIPSYGDPNLESELEGVHAVINEQKIVFDWDVVQSATPFATLAAILAGFVVIAIVAILTFGPTAGAAEQQYAPLVPFLAAFFTLILAAFLFSVLAGSGAAGGNRLLPLAEGSCLSWIYGGGVVQTCGGIAWLMTDYQVSSAVEPVNRTARWIVHLGVGLAAIATSGILVQPLYVLYSDQGAEGNAAWALTAALPIVAIPIGARFRKRVLAGEVNRASGKSQTASLVLLKYTTWLAIALVLVMTVGYGAASGSTEQVIRSSYGLLFGLMVLAQIALCGLFAAYEASLPPLEREVPKPAPGVGAAPVSSRPAPG